MKKLFNFLSVLAIAGAVVIIVIIYFTPSRLFNFQSILIVITLAAISAALRIIANGLDESHLKNRFIFIDETIFDTLHLPLTENAVQNSNTLEAIRPTLKTNPIKCFPSIYEPIINLWKNGCPVSLVSLSLRRWVEILTSEALLPTGKKQETKLSEIFANQIFSSQDCEGEKSNFRKIFSKAFSGMRVTKGKTFLVTDNHLHVVAGTVTNCIVLGVFEKCKKEAYVGLRNVIIFENPEQRAQYILKNLC